MFGCAKRSLRSHPRINPSTQPSDVAGGSRSKAGELTLGLLSGEERGVVGVGFVVDSPLTPALSRRERGPIFVFFKASVRRGIARRRNSPKHHGQSPLPLGEG
ncbi:hypothetical protein EMIT0P265_30586 [Pseudomonas zeae]